MNKRKSLINKWDVQGGGMEIIIDLINRSDDLVSLGGVKAYKVILYTLST